MYAYEISHRLDKLFKRAYYLALVKKRNLIMKQAFFIRVRNEEDS